MWKKFLKIAIALVIALLAVAALNYYYNKGAEKITVYRAKTFIAEGADLNTDMFYSSTISRDAYTDAILNIDDIKNKDAKYDILAEDILRSVMITDIYESVDVYKDTLDPGYSFVSIPVDLVSGLGGMIKSGNYVNVIGVVEKNGDFYFSERAFEKVKVVDVFNRRAVTTDTPKNQIANTSYDDHIPNTVVLEIETSSDTTLYKYSSFSVVYVSDDYVITGNNNRVYSDEAIQDKDAIDE